jgi:hypothetical protein
MRKLMVLLVLVGVGLLAWTQQDRIRSLFGEEPAAVSEDVTATPELADLAVAKIERLRKGEVDRVAFHSSELQSLLLYRFVQLLPAFVDSPRVNLVDGRIEVDGRVPVENLPSISELGEAAAFWPDTAEVAMKGKLLPLDSGRVALSIEEVKAARIPLPDRLVPRALTSLGRKDEPGLAKNSVAIALPRGIGGARIENDSLVLFAHPVSRPNN